MIHLIEKKEQFIASRGVLRFLLGGYLQTIPQEVPLSQGLHGKPFVPASNLSFNLSHSGDYILYICARQCAVGVDIEQMRPGLVFHKLMRSHFSEQERLSITSLPQDQQEQAFFRLWTRKEAYLKALGTGFSFPLPITAISVIPKEGLQASPTQLEELPSHWYIKDIFVDTGYSSSIALEHPRTLQFYDVELST